VWFGPVPVAALPANLLAAPVAGLLMIWGITAGLVAGVVGPPLATVLHIPSSLGLHWISGVATQVGERPFAALPTGGALLLVGMVFLAAGASHRENFTAARSALTAVLLALLLVGGATFLRSPVTEVSDGLRVTSAGKLVVVDDHYGAEELLGRLRRHQIVAPELLIFRNAVDQAVLAALAQRFDDVAIWAPRGPQPAVVPDSGTVVMAGQQQWQVDQQSGHLLVRPVG
jgi:competence protein ComEC